jgi:nucleoside-diphosphate-sugar epimerase
VAVRIFVAGASGVIGRRLVPLLVGEGHDVAAMTRTAANAPALERAGAQPVVCDVYDAERLTFVMREFEPEVVLDELTDLPDDPADFPQFRERNDRMRIEGTLNLLAAAEQADGPIVIAQSIAWDLPDPRSRQAVLEHEAAVLERDGVIVRYGQLYGPGTFYPDEPPGAPRIHVDDAASLTLAALSAAPGTTLTIADEPEAGERTGTIRARA